MIFFEMQIALYVESDLQFNLGEFNNKFFKFQCYQIYDIQCSKKIKFKL